MKKVTAIVAIGAAMTIFTAANPAYADGWQRSRKVIGPYGGVHTFEGHGYCNENGCKSRQQWTGPRGRMFAFGPEKGMVGNRHVFL